jgi:ABC-2 type transport system permease protein
MILRPLYAVMEREIRRTLRQRTRLLAALVRPLIWLFIIGAGFGAVYDAGDLGYQQYLVPGIVGMTLLFGAMLAALSLVHDKESGVMRMLVIAPFAHHWIVLAKMLAAALAALLQALLLLAVLALLGFLDPQMRWPLLALALVVCALACAGIGVVTAAFSRTLENFAAVMNFVIFPVFFLSGALYAVGDLPAPLRLAARLNPFTHAVDLLKHAMLVPLGARDAAEFALAADLLYALGFTVIALAVASWRFSQESRYEPLIHTLAGKRGG